MTDAKEKNKAAFKQKLAVVLRDLQDGGSKDDEAVWLTGSLAAQLLDKAEKPSWPQLKVALSNEAYDGLLASFQTQGNKLATEGNHKAAYAMQNLGISVIGSRLNDAEIATGTQLLDQFIDAAINYYRKGMAAKIVAESAKPTMN